MISTEGAPGLVALASAHQTLRERAEEVRDALVVVVGEQLDGSQVRGFDEQLWRLYDGAVTRGRLEALASLPRPTVSAIPIAVVRALTHGAIRDWPEDPINRGGLVFEQVHETPQDVLARVRDVLEDTPSADPAPALTPMQRRFQGQVKELGATVEGGLSLLIDRIIAEYPQSADLKPFFLQLVTLASAAGFVGLATEAIDGPPLDHRWLRWALIRADDAEHGRLKVRQKIGIELSDFYEGEVEFWEM